MNTKLLKKSVIGKDFLSALALKQEQPSIDKFLDYRSALMKKKESPEFIKREIKAVDEILNVLTKQKGFCGEIGKRGYKLPED